MTTLLFPLHDLVHPPDHGHLAIPRNVPARLDAEILGQRGILQQVFSPEVSEVHHGDVAKLRAFMHELETNVLPRGIPLHKAAGIVDRRPPVKNMVTYLQDGYRVFLNEIEGGDAEFHRHALLTGIRILEGGYAMPVGASGVPAAQTTVRPGDYYELLPEMWHAVDIEPGKRSLSVMVQDMTRSRIRRRWNQAGASGLRGNFTAMEPAELTRINEAIERRYQQ